METHEHIVRSYEEELSSLNNKIAKMGGLAEQVLGQSIDALEGRDPDLAAATIQQDEAIDALEAEIEEQAITMIARRQPMAYDLRQIMATASYLKQQLAIGVRPPVLERRVLALLFEKPSLRTRVSFEAGIAQLGGTSLFLGEEVGWGKRESYSDFARVLGEYVDVVVCRAKSHDRVQQFAAFDLVPVINGLTDLSHPCQAIADAMTIEEAFGTLAGKRLVFVGDGNNVARSLMLILTVRRSPGDRARGSVKSRLWRSFQSEKRFCGGAG